MLYEKAADKNYYFLLDERKCDYCKFSATPHCHDSIEFLIIEKGSVLTSVNGASQTLCENSIAFIDSYDIHSYYSTELYGYVLVFSKEYCRLFSEAEYTFNNFITLNADAFNKILNAVKNFYGNYTDNKNNRYLVESLSSFIMGVLLQNETTITKNKDKTKEVMVEVLNYINDNFDKEIDMPSVANEFGYTPNYFSNIFNKFTKMSFNDYVNLIRYKKALKILKNNVHNYSITDIAFSCGFGSMNTFYRTKKKFENIQKS